MKIRIDDTFGISTDENNFTLYEIKTKGKDAKDAGAEYEATVGYFGALKGALLGYLKYSLRRNSEGVETVDQLLQRLEEIENIIKGLK